MEQDKTALAVIRDPKINVPRSVFKAPAITQPTAWRAMSRMERRARYSEDEPTTQPTSWIREDQLKAPWWELHPEWKPSAPIDRPPLPADAGHPVKLTKVSTLDKSKDSEKESLPPGKPEVQEKRLRSGEEKKDDKDDKQPAKKQKLDEGKRKEVPEPLKQTHGPPKRPPGILPLSPQEARTPRPKNPYTDDIRAKFPGPGNFEHRWRNNPDANINKEVLNSVAAFNELPEVRQIPQRMTKGQKVMGDFKYMGDQKFYSMWVPDDGNCFFGAVSVALYGTSKFWHLVKYEHLYFVRYVLTHPAHPRYDFYWSLNDKLSPRTHYNMWQTLNVPHAWQFSELFNVTADIYNLFIILYEQLPRLADESKSQKKQDNQTIGLFGQYNATHVFFHLLERNHYKTLQPRKNPEVQFPFPDGTTIVPGPGRAKQRPFGGTGRPILPPPIAQPIIPPPRPLDMARVLGYNTVRGTMNLDFMNRWIRIERREAEDKNDPTSLKWWLEEPFSGYEKPPSSVGPSKAPAKDAATGVIDLISSDEEKR
ncbi:hypothetical protein EYC80_006270 [Monilinia laxa]|uniref:OTU domain-containing protein n=1 Tax=Monilinia laxa TaxID=61186 RepID=A0A5N6KH01_MONLA|nr:hypothetical protein EYC80_006270 [Monilinia laxa]